MEQEGPPHEPQPQIGSYEELIMAAEQRRRAERRQGFDDKIDAMVADPDFKEAFDATVAEHGETHEE